MVYSTIFQQYKQKIWFITLHILAGIAINLLLKNINALINMPFFFDSIATATVAALFGLLPGLLTGIGTNVIQEVFYGFTLTHYPWALCSASTAIIVAVFVRYSSFKTIKDAAIVSLLVTLSNSVLGALIATYIFSGITGVPLDYIVISFITSGQSTLLATFLARLPSNLIDKSISVFVAFYLYFLLRVKKNE